MTYPQPFSDYEILERVGSGSMGTVFKARHLKLGRTVALKVLRPSLARNERYVARLRREARIVAALQHPNIVTGYDLGEEGGYHFFVMEYVDGPSLKQLLAEWGSFPEQRVVGLGIQVASALDHAFRRGVIHRDIKPGNILIDDNDRVLLTDMGLAKGQTDATITRHGATMGTPQYISPEQARDPHSADVRSDLYSLGATLFHMATGVPPFTGENMGQVLTRVLGERAPSLTEVNPQLSDGLALVTRKLLAKDPGLRYQTPAELLDDLRRVEREELPKVDLRRLERGDRGMISRAARWRRAGVVTAATVIVLATVAGIGWAAGLWRGDGNALAAPAVGEAALRGQVAAASGYRAKLAAVRAAEAAAQPAAAVVRAEVEARLRDDLSSVLAQLVYGERAAEVDAWVRRPETWIDSEARLEDWVAGLLGDALGIQPVELPAALRAVFAQRAGPLRDRVRSLRGRLESEFRRRVSEFVLRGLPAAWQGRLEERDFPGAARAVDARVEEFFADDAWPSREQLPPALRDEVGQRIEEARQRAVSRIADEEEREAELVRQRVGAELSRLRAVLASGQVSAARLRSTFGQWREDLLRWPGAAEFRLERSPWPVLRASLTAFDAELSRAERIEEDVAFAQSVARCYSALVLLGDPAAAMAWLERDFASAENAAQRDRHRALLRGAAAAATAVWDAVLGDQSARRIELPSGPAGLRPRRVLHLSRNAGALQARDADGAELVLSELPWSVLLGWLRGQGAASPLAAVTEADRDAAAAGLALWGIVSGGGDAALASLEPQWRSFLVRGVDDAVAAARRAGERREERALAGQLQTLRATFAASPRDYDAVAGALAAVAAGAGAAGASAFLAEVEEWLVEEAGRRDLRQKIGAAVGAGAVVRVESSDRAVVEYSLAELLGGSSAGAWSLRDDALGFAAVDVDLAAARQQALPVMLPDAGLVELSLDLRVAWPALPDRARLYAIEIAGALVLVGALRTGQALAVIVPAGDADREGVLRRALQAALERARRQPAAWIVPDGRHSLQLDLRLGAKRVDVRAALDGVELVRQPVPRSAPGLGAARLMPLQPWTLHGVSLTVRDTRI